MEITIEFDMPQLVSYQQEWMRDQHQIIGIEGCTSCGKTYVHIPWFVAEAHQPQNKGDEFWWVAPSVDKSKEVFRDIERTIEEAGALSEYKINKTERTIETPWGGIMIFKTGEKVNLLFGTRNVRLIVVDEFTRCRFDIWTPLKTVMDKTGCPIRFLGNFTGDDTEWHRWIEAMKDRPEFKYYLTTSSMVIESGLRTKEWEDAARPPALPEPIFNALYLCKGSADSSLLTNYGAVGDLWNNDHVPEGEKGITADIALHGSDRFVMGVWSGFRLKEVTCLEKKTAKEIEDILKGKAAEHGIGRSQIAYDADGLGAYLKSYLQGAGSYQGGHISIPQKGQKLSYARLRDQCHFLAADRINARGYYVEDTLCRPELEKELLATLRKLGQNPAGQWMIVPKDHTDPPGAKQRLGRSPDYSDMFIMREFQFLTPGATMIDNLHREQEQKRTLRFGQKKDEGSKFRIEGR